MGTDLAASVSASDSTTQGIETGFRDLFGGDFIVGSGASKQELPVWALPALVAGVVIVLVVWLVRR